eukprot:Gb_10274 [translate_table: standard]
MAMDSLFMGVFVLLCCSSHAQPCHSLHFTHTNYTDQRALLEFKAGVSDDPRNSLQDWNPTHMMMCNWRGVGCSLRRNRVTTLNLTGMGLEGPISPLLGNLSFLRLLDLSNNSFHGHIPYQLGRLFRLRTLRMSYNHLEGSIPSSLGACHNLQKLALYHNNLTGSIPTEVGLLANLNFLWLGDNKLTGTIPASLANISWLISLDLSTNSLHGQMVASLSNCSHLVELYLADNRLSRHVPAEFCHLTHLNVLSLALGRLLRLQRLDLSSNHLVSGGTTTLPFLTALTNCSLLEIVLLSHNHLTGVLPSSIGKLSSRLSILYLDHNEIAGKLCEHIGNLTSLTFLALDGNLFNGSIPSAFRRLQKLERLYMGGSNLEGSIPTEIGEMQSLGLLSLQQTMLSGQIPASLGRLPQLRRLYLNQNQLSGNIPISLGQCQNLELLDLSYNQLTGNIPQQLAGLPNLIFFFNLSNNFLQGSVPSQMSKMVMVQAIDISENHLTGAIPSTLGSCIALQHLNLSRNALEGPIPVSLGELQNLQDMDFSSNHLSGKIPSSLEKLKMLRQLNFSQNNLTGEVPRKGIFAILSAAAFMGNPGLCGPWLHLPPCPRPTSDRDNSHFSFKKVMTVSVICTVASIIGCLLMGFFWKKNCKRRLVRKALAIRVEPLRISYEELVTATHAFCEANLVGVGSFGKVYKGILNNGTPVAVKVLNLQNENAHRSFHRECKVLRRVRHRNLITVITTCSNHEFKALILPFMSNGSLEKRLYDDDALGLDLSQRLNIAIDIAQGMAYLHHDCSVQVIHCDLKPSNVLLDGDMTAHVADFGIARLACANSMDSITSTQHALGSVGYIAPEYGTGGRASAKGDVYSYGILLLELLTRKRPSDDMFVGGLNLPKWVCIDFGDRITQVVDSSLLSVGTESDDRILNCITALIRLGLVCTKESAAERPSMREIVAILERMRGAFDGTAQTCLSALDMSTLLERSINAQGNGASESQTSSTL